MQCDASRADAVQPEVLVLLSGGVDSAACLEFFIESGRYPSALFVDYMQPARDEESKAANSVATYYGVELHRARWVSTNLKTFGEIPGRNAFLVIAALMERPETVTSIAIGVHAGTEYADCSPEFVEKMQKLIDVYTDGSIQLVAPFLTWTKPDIWAYATTRDVPVNVTYSCEKEGHTPCGECLSCRDRKALNALS